MGGLLTSVRKSLLPKLAVNPESLETLEFDKADDGGNVCVEGIP